VGPGLAEFEGKAGGSTVAGRAWLLPATPLPAAVLGAAPGEPTNRGCLWWSCDLGSGAPVEWSRLLSLPSLEAATGATGRSRGSSARSCCRGCVCCSWCL
jgi:hypothetical protein